MKNHSINTYILITFLLLGVIACNPKEEIVPENPCGSYKEPSADFIMEQTTGRRNANNTDYIWLNNPFIPKDTIVISHLIQFKSELTDTNVYKHTWYVGSEVFHNYKVWRDFDVFPNTYITIYHVVKWQPNKNCNPNDDGYDSTSFTFQVVDRFKALYTVGKYRMVYDTAGAPSNQDSVEVEVYFSKINDADSALIDPKTNMDYDLRIKGLLTEYPKGSMEEGIVPSNKDPLDENKISNTYLISSPTAITGFFSRFYLYISANGSADLKYYNFAKNYKLKGRKIN